MNARWLGGARDAQHAPEPSRPPSKPSDTHGSIRLRRPRIPVSLQCSCGSGFLTGSKNAGITLSQRAVAAPGQSRVPSRLAGWAAT
jgi:hypothetical protein